MKAAQFEFIKAQSLTQTHEQLSAGRSEIKIMAGSQSLGPMLNLRLARPQSIIDISALNELKTVTLEGTMLRVGAGVTHAQIEDGVFDLLRNHPWRTVASSIAYRSVRNRGTIGGSIAHADPAADWVLAAATIGAHIEIASKQAIRLVPMSEFMLGAYTTAISEQEVITAIHLPIMSQGSRWGYFKFCRKIGEFAESSCAAYFDRERKVANIFVGALDGAPQELNTLAKMIASQGWTEVLHAEVSQQVSASLPALDSLDQKMIVGVVKRCLDRTFSPKVQS